jgi:hypothetical protein
MAPAESAARAALVRIAWLPFRLRGEVGDEERDVRAERRDEAGWVELRLGAPWDLLDEGG